METRRRITAGCSSQFDLAFVFPNNIGIMWEVEGNGEARVFQLRMLPDIIQYLAYHRTLSCSWSTPF